MIQIETSRSGHRILKKDGRLLASSFDPLKEAHAWAQQASQTLGFDKAETLIILGLGCGYHISELSSFAQVAQSIIVIEPNAEVAAATLESVSFEEKVTIIIEPHARQLLAHRELITALHGQMTIIPHQPSVASDEEYFGFAQKLFLSRDMTSFLLHLRNRPELYAAIDQATLQKLAATNDPVTIQTLRQLFRREGLMSHERRVWKALEELIT